MRQAVLAPLTATALGLLAVAAPSVANAQGINVTPTPTPAGPGADDSRSMPHEITFFADFAYVLAARNVEFESAPDDNDGAALPRVALGVGLWFGDNGLGESLFDPLNKPFGIRVGVSGGGSIGGKDVQDAEDNDFSDASLELELLAPWNEYGVGPQIVLSTWEFFGPLDVDVEFRNKTILADELVRQKIESFGAGLPIPLVSGGLTLGGPQVPSFFGVVAKYTFMQITVQSETPALRGSVPNHVILAGVFFDWGVTPWLRANLQVELGLIAGHAESAVVNTALNIQFIHVPTWWLDNNLQFIAKLSVEATTLQLGSRYLIDPSASKDEGAITFVNFALRIGLRVWF